MENPREVAHRACVSSTDRAWLDTAHQTNLAEVEAGELAHKKGTSAAVRADGVMLVTDHTRFDTSVVRVARSLRVDLNDAAPPEDAAATDRFADESGTSRGRRSTTTSSSPC